MITRPNLTGRPAGSPARTDTPDTTSTLIATTQRQQAQGARAQQSEADRAAREQDKAQRDADKEAQRQANDAKEAQFRREGRPSYVDAHSNIQPVQTDEEWQAKQASERANADRYAQFKREGRPFFEDKVTREVIPTHTDEQWSKMKADRDGKTAEKLRRDQINEQLRAHDADATYAATQPGGAPLDKPSRAKAQKTLADATRAAVTTLLPHLDQQAQATTGSIPFLKSPTPEATTASTRSKALREKLFATTDPHSPVPLDDEDLATLAKVKPELHQQLTATRAALAQDDAAQTEHQKRQQVRAELLLKRDDPAKWEELQRQKIVTDPTKAAGDLTNEHARQLTDLTAQLDAFEGKAKQLDSQRADLEAQNQALAQQGFAADDAITVVGPDKQPRPWSKKLFTQLQQIQEQQSELTREDNPERQRLNVAAAETEKMRQLAVAAHEQKKKASDARTQEKIQQLGTTAPKFAADLNAIDQDRVARIADLEEMHPDGIPDDVIAALDQDIQAKQAAAIAAQTQRQQAGSDLYRQLRQFNPTIDWTNPPDDVAKQLVKTKAKELGLDEQDAQAAIATAVQSDWTQRTPQEEAAFQAQQKEAKKHAMYLGMIPGVYGAVSALDNVDLTHLPGLKEAQDWLHENITKTDLTRPSAPFRLLPDGSATINPALALDKKQWDAAIASASKVKPQDPEHLAALEQNRQAQINDLGARAWPMLTTDGQYRDFVADHDKNDPGFKALSVDQKAAKFLTEGKGQQWFIDKLASTTGQALLNGLVGLGNTAIGLAHMATGSDWLAQRMEAADTYRTFSTQQQAASGIQDSTLLRSVAAITDTTVQFAPSLMGGAVGQIAGRVASALSLAEDAGGFLKALQTVNSVRQGAGMVANAATATKAAAMLPKAESFGAMLIGSAAGGAQTTQQVYTEAYQHGLDEGMTADQARSAATMPALAAGLGTTLLAGLQGLNGVASVFRGEVGESITQALSKDTLRNLAKLKTDGLGALKDKAVRSAVADATKALGGHMLQESFGVKGEALNEFLDQLQQGIIAKATYEPDKKPGEILAESLQAGLLGGVTGGLVGGIHGGVEIAGEANPVKTTPIHQRPEVIRTAERELETLTDNPVMQQRGGSLLAIAQGQIDQLTPEELAPLGLSIDDKGKLSTTATPDGTPAAVKLVKGQPVITQAALDELETALPAVRRAIGMDEAAATQYFTQRKDQATKAPSTDSPTASPGSESAQAGAIQPTDVGAGHDTGAGGPVAPSATATAAGGPTTPAAADPRKAKFIAKTLINRGVEPEVAHTIGVHLSNSSPEGESTEQLRDRALSEFEQMGGKFPDDTGGQSAGATLNTDVDYWRRSGLNEKAAQEAAANSQAEIDAKRQAASAANAALAQKLSQRAPATSSPPAAADFTALREQVRAKKVSQVDAARRILAATQPQDLESAAADLQQHLNTNDKSAKALLDTIDWQPSQPTASQKTAKNVQSVTTTGSPSSKASAQPTPQNVQNNVQTDAGTPVAALLDDPEFIAHREQALSNIKVMTKRTRAKKLFALLDQHLVRYAHFFPGGIKVTRQSDSTLAGPSGLAISKGDRALHIDLNRIAASFDNSDPKLAARDLLTAFQEEMVHSAQLELRQSKPERHSEKALAELFRKLPEKLQARIYQSYHAIDIERGTKDKALPTDAPDAQLADLMDEYGRMLIQSDEFQSVTEVTIADNPTLKPALVQWLRDLIASLSRLLKAAPRDIQHEVQEYKTRAVAVLHRLLKQSPSATATGSTVAKAAMQTQNLANAPSTRSATAQPQDIPNAKPKPLTGTAGNETTAYTDNNDAITTRWHVAEVDDLVISNDDSGRINPDYPQILQPRDRTSAGSEAQVNDIASNTNLDRLSHSPGVGDGAPIVSPDDSVVESGNGRLMGLRRAYAQGKPNASTYRDALIARAAEFGLDPEKVKAMKHPVLVRARMTPVDRSTFVLAANVSNIAPKREVEIAKTDAQQITPDLFGTFTPDPETGDFLTAQNHDFIRSFVRDIVPQAERPGIIDSKGQLSQTGQRRIRNALFAYAYGTSPEALNALANLTEATDPRARNISNAIVGAAPAFAEQNAREQAGALYPLSITSDIVVALQGYLDAKAAGQTVDDWLAQDRIPGIDNAPTDLQGRILRVLDAHSNAPRKLLDILSRYARAVDSAGDPRQASLFGDEKPTKLDLWRLASQPSEVSNDTLATAARPGQSQIIDTERALTDFRKLTTRADQAPLNDAQSTRLATAQRALETAFKLNDSTLATTSRPTAKAAAEAAGYDTSEVFHHGTDANFEEFRPEFTAKQIGLHWFTTNSDVAKTFTKGYNDTQVKTSKVLSFYLKPGKAFVVNSPESMQFLRESIARHSVAVPTNWDKPGSDYLWAPFKDPRIISDIKAAGFNSIRMERPNPARYNWDDPATITTVAVWDANRVKIADESTRFPVSERFDDSSNNFLKTANRHYPHESAGDFRSNWKVTASGRTVRLADGKTGTVTRFASDKDFDVRLTDGTTRTSLSSKQVWVQLTSAEREVEPHFIRRLTEFDDRKPAYDATLRAIAAALPDATPILAPLKGAPRALEKLADKLAKKRAMDPGATIRADAVASELADILRGSIIIDNLDDRAATLRLIDAAFEGQENIVVEDRFTDPTPAGYSDIQIKVRVGPDHYAELQVHIPEMLAAKEGNLVKEMGVPERYWPENLNIPGLNANAPGHKLFEVWRSTENAAAKATLGQKMRALYQAAKDAYEARRAATTSSNLARDTSRSTDTSLADTETSDPSRRTANALPSRITNGSPSSSTKNLGSSLTGYYRTEYQQNQGISPLDSDNTLATPARAPAADQLDLFDLLTPAQQERKLAQPDLFSNDRDNGPRKSPSAPRIDKTVRAPRPASPAPKSEAPESLFGDLFSQPDDGQRISGSRLPRKPGPRDKRTRSGDIGDGVSGPTDQGPADKPADSVQGDPPGLSRAPALIPQPADPADRNHRINGSGTVAPKGGKAKLEANFAAMKLVRELDAAGRNATPEEKQILAAYTGWGWMKEAFNTVRARKYEDLKRSAEIYIANKPRWDSRRFNTWREFYDGRNTDSEDQRILSWADTYLETHERLKAELSEKEFHAAEKSTLNAHFTTPSIIDAMWKAVSKLGFKGGRAMEPGGGIGHFIGVQPEDLANRTQWEATELDDVTARILARLYPQARVNSAMQGANREVSGMGFQNARIPNNSLDLFISNVPFAKQGPGKAKSEFGQDFNLHNYFFARALAKVKPGGLIAFITTSNTMESSRAQRDYLNNHGQLVAAVRLPNNAFKENAGTEVTTDIIILRKPDDSSFVGEPWRERIKVGEDTVTSKRGKIGTSTSQKIEDWLGSIDPEWIPADAALVEPFQAWMKGGRPATGQKRNALITAIQTTHGYNVQKLDFHAPIYVNEYFARHPENVMGTHRLVGSMYRAGEYTVTPKDEPLDAQLDQFVNRLPEDIMSQSATDDYAAKAAERGDKVDSYVERDGKIYQVSKEGLEPVEWQVLPGMDAKTKAAAERKTGIFRQWAKLREAAVELVKLEANPLADEAEMKAARAMLNQVYDRTVEKHGALSKRRNNNYRFLDDDPEAALLQALEDEVRTTDKDGKVTYTYTKTDIFRRRIIEPQEAPTTAANLEEAVSISMAWEGTVNPQYVADLLGTDAGLARQQLIEGGHAFEDPSSGLLMTADEYLSGPVSERLRLAQEAVKDSPQYARNVTALRAALPPHKAISEASVILGQRWVPDSIYTAFARSLGIEDGTVEFSKELNSFSVRGEGSNEEWNVGTQGAKDILDAVVNNATLVYRSYVRGEGMQVDEELTATLRVKADEMRDAFSTFVKTTEEQVPDPEFEGQTIPIPDLAERDFNQKVNGIKPPDYVGDWVKLPGQSGIIRLKPFRKAVLARLITQGRGMMAHGVGSGKTYNQIALAMELRRLGKARKPVIVVQNSTINQFAASFRKAYPQAKILVATPRSYNAQTRARFTARMATGDWDAIIMTHSNIDLIGHSAETVSAYFAKELEELDAALMSSDASDQQSDLQQARDSLIEKRDEMMQALGERQDDTLNWEDIGVDALIVDEAHAFKNAPVVTNRGRDIKNIPSSGVGSQRAVSMMMKTRSVRERNNQRGVFFATGTPVSNSMAEAFIMLRYIAPDMLEANGIRNFDDFASQYGDVVSQAESTWDGKVKMVDRFAKFVNGQQLINLVRSVFDVAMGNESLGIDVPTVKGGKPRQVVVGATPANLAFNNWILQDVAPAWEAITRKDIKDNPKLSAVPIMTMQAGIAAALDPRLIHDLAPDDSNSKVNTAIREVLRIYKSGTARKTAQVIFSDLFNSFNMDILEDFAGHPFEDFGENPIRKNGKVRDDGTMPRGNFNLGADIKAKLIAAGIPEREIMVVTDQKDEALTTIFDKVNDGDIRVIIGSTGRLGVGVNIQERLAAVHHLMPPRDFKPAMMEQRNGRIIRQGNLHAEWRDIALVDAVERLGKTRVATKDDKGNALSPAKRAQAVQAWLAENDKDGSIKTTAEAAAREFDIEIIEYGVERSLDSAVYSMMAAKQGMIAQVLTADAVGNEFEDPSDEIRMNMAEMAAHTMGDPDMIRTVTVDKIFRELRAAYEGFQRMDSGRRSDARRLTHNINIDTLALPRIDSEAARYGKLWEANESKPVYDFGGTTVNTAEKDAKITKPLDLWITENAREMALKGQQERTAKLTINGQDFNLTVKGESDPTELNDGGVYGFVEIAKSDRYVNFQGGARGVLQALHRLTEFAATRPDETRANIAKDSKKLEQIEAFLAKEQGFPRMEELQAIMRERQELQQRINARNAPAPMPPSSNTVRQGLTIPPLAQADPALLTPEVNATLAQAVITDNSLVLPEQLDRKLYEKVNKALESAGGVWSKRDKAHLFAGDPRPYLGLAPKPESTLATPARAVYATTDEFTGHTSYISGSALSREQGQAGSLVHAARLRSLLRAGKEERDDAQAGADRRATTVPRLNAAQFQRILDLPVLGRGLEAEVYGDRANGVVYKVLWDGQDNPSHGIFPELQHTSSGRLDWHLMPSEMVDSGSDRVNPRLGARRLAERLAVQSLIGGTPTEIAGVGPDGHIVLKQPWSPDPDMTSPQTGSVASANQRAGLARIPANLISDPEAPPAYVAVVNLDGTPRPYFVTDLADRNYVADNQHDARINDAAIAPITSDLLDKVPALRPVVAAATQNAQQTGDRTDRLFTTTRPGNMAPMADETQAAQNNSSSPGGLNEADGRYLEAVNRGDMEMAQRMVDEAAKKHGYLGVSFYHGTAGDVFHQFNFELSSKERTHGGKSTKSTLWLTDNRRAAEMFAIMRAAKLSGGDPFNIGLSILHHGFTTSDKSPLKEWPQYADKKPRTESFFVKGDLLKVEMNPNGDSEGIGLLVNDKLKEARKLKKDGVFFVNLKDFYVHNAIAAFRSISVKSADPITRDTQGNVIPLSKRFDTGNDIRGDVSFDTSAPTTGVDDAAHAADENQAAQNNSSLPGGLNLSAEALKRGFLTSRHADYPNGFVRDNPQGPPTLIYDQEDQRLANRVWSAENEGSGILTDRQAESGSRYLLAIVDGEPVHIRIADHGNRTGNYEVLGRAEAENRAVLNLLSDRGEFADSHTLLNSSKGKHSSEWTWDEMVAGVRSERRKSLINDIAVEADSSEADASIAVNRHAPNGVFNDVSWEAMIADAKNPAQSESRASATEGQRPIRMVNGATETPPSPPEVNSFNSPTPTTGVDAAAHAAATSPRNALPEPTEAQKRAGNYTKGHIRISGLPMSIENPADSVRSGTDANGKSWSTTMHAHYGYVLNSEGKDGDHVDVFVKPGTPEDYTGPVFVVDQLDPETGKFDEHKAIIGTATAEEAAQLYLSNYEPGWKGLGPITQMPWDAFKTWSRSAAAKKPAARTPHPTVKPGLQVPSPATPAPQGPPSPAPGATLQTPNRMTTEPGRGVVGNVAGVSSSATNAPGAWAFNHIDKSFTDHLGKLNKMVTSTKPVQALSDYVGSSKAGEFFKRAMEAAKKHFAPMQSLAPEALAMYREMNIRSAFGKELAMDVFRSLDGKGKFTDLAYPPGFAENKAAKRDLYLAMTGGKPVTELAPELQNLAKQLRSLLVRAGEEAVTSGRMSRETFDNLKGDYLPHYYAQDARPEPIWTKAARVLGIRDVLAQRTTAWHLVDTETTDARTGKAGDEGALVTWDGQGKQWRFRSSEHLNAFYHDFIADQVFAKLKNRSDSRLRGITREALNDPKHMLTDYQQGIVREMKLAFTQRYKRKAPLTVDEQEKAGLLMDPVYSVVRYLAQMHHDNAVADFFNEIAARTDWTSDTPVQGYTPIPDSRKYGRLAGKYVQENLARQILDVVGDDGSLMDLYDDLVRRWSAGKTVWNPGTHVRNFLGNIVFTQLAGVNLLNPVANWSYYRDAVKLMRGDQRDLLRAAFEQGVIGADYSSAELRGALRGLLPDPDMMGDKAPSVSMISAWAHALTPEKLRRAFEHVGAKAHTVYAGTDDFFKLAAWMKHRAMGATDAAAAAEVRKWFPYYDNIGSSGALKFIRRVHPFFSFFRESVRILGNAVKERPLSLTGSMIMPLILTRIAAGLAGLRDDRDRDQVERDMKGHLKVFSSLPVFSILLPWRMEGKLAQFDLTNIHPFANLLSTNLDTKQEDLITTTAKQIMSGSPITGLLYSMAANEDPFNNRPITQPDMGTVEGNWERFKHTWTQLAPAVLGSVPNQLGSAFTRSTNKTLEKRNVAQSFLRGILGIDIRNASPDLYRLAEDFRAANKLPDNVFTGGTTAQQRLRKALFSELVQDDPNLIKVKNIVLKLRESGKPVESQQDINRLLFYRDPKMIVDGKINQQMFAAGLPEEARRLMEDAQTEFRRVQQTAPATIALALSK